MENEGIKELISIITPHFPEGSKMPEEIAKEIYNASFRKVIVGEQSIAFLCYILERIQIIYDKYDPREHVSGYELMRDIEYLFKDLIRG